ncbi:hypothetical protein GCM10011383_02120 [Hymenobacter cavernae]|uniref:Lipocalin-like domain-containing protein n=2 Tax=Hymenobacter cavernae TaxID=2044852 RepID=A0ABQ1TJR3_9BACT|nr:hypothetical protein GCM10011383_02120 [Hymenobacter cavernae]
MSSCQKDDADVTILSPVAGSYYGEEPCNSEPYTVDIYNQSDAKNGKVFISNLYGLGDVYEATVSGNTITLPPTPYSYVAGGKTYKGNITATGTLEGSVITIKYTLDGDDPEQCTFVGDREFRGPTVQGG